MTMQLNSLYLSARYNHELQTQGWAQVRAAQNSGRLEKPELCEYCSKRPPRLFHHTNYLNPLEGKWVCHSCHRKEHARLKRIVHDNS